MSVPIIADGLAEVVISREAEAMAQAPIANIKGIAGMSGLGLPLLPSLYEFRPSSSLRWL
jgi:hypothetical protein